MYKRNVEEYMEHEVVKWKWEITNDAVINVGKYSTDNNDYVNILKVLRRFKLVLMFYFNPQR